MKKRLILLPVLLLVFGTMQVYSVGIGIRGNYSWGSEAGVSLLISPGLSADSSVHLGIDAWMFSGGLGFGITGDYWFFQTAPGDTFDFYVGGGLFGRVHLGDELWLYGGARLPIGIDLNFGAIDLFLEVVPQIGLSIIPSIGLWSNWGTAAVGIRVWF